MHDENNRPSASSRRCRGPKGFGEKAARALEQSLGSSQGRGTVEEESFLKEWFSEQGCLIPESEWVSHKLIPNITAEHEVRFREHDHRAIKRTYPGTFGNTPRNVLGEWTISPATPSQYLNRMALQNDIFSDDIFLEGGMISDGPSMIIGQLSTGLSLVISQPWLDALDENQPYPSEEELIPYLQERGFRSLINSFYGWINEHQQLVVLDAKADNFIRTPDGILPIDLVIAEYEQAA